MAAASLAWLPLTEMTLTRQKYRPLEGHFSFLPGEPQEPLSEDFLLPHGPLRGHFKSYFSWTVQKDFATCKLPIWHFSHLLV